MFLVTLIVKVFLLLLTYYIAGRVITSIQNRVTHNLQQLKNLETKNVKIHWKAYDKRIRVYWTQLAVALVAFIILDIFIVFY